MNAQRCIGAAFVLAALVGCGGDDFGSDSQNLTNVDLPALFGDDRVSDALCGLDDDGNPLLRTRGECDHLERIPSNYAAAEKLFGVGRACERDDSKEIFVLEERSSRAGGENVPLEALLPRAVVTGCNTRPASEGSFEDSFSLFLALFSSPNAAEPGNAMVFEPVEVMALDRTTGLYNFYVLGVQGEGTMTRLRRLASDHFVETFYDHDARSSVSDGGKGRQCQNCHINMGPVMNELGEPWTNWVSQHQPFPQASDLTGDTAEIVDEALSRDGSHVRSSLANDLEPIMKAAIRAFASGHSEDVQLEDSDGLIQQTLDGRQPYPIDHPFGMMRSVFCETELNFESAFSVVPLSLFMDPAAIAGGGFMRPPADPIDLFPRLLPVRSEMDKRIEIGLIKKGILSKDTVRAIRVWDDQNDIFSDARCSLLDPLVAGMPKQLDDIDAYIAAFLLERLDEAIAPGPRQDFLRALLRSEDVNAARDVYLASAAAVLAAETSKLLTDAGVEELKQRSDERKRRAVELLPGPASPLPILDYEAKPLEGE